jgi:hypothetical protein
MSPGAAIGRVFKHTAEATYCGQGVGKASIVIAELVLVRLAGASMPKPAPTLTGRMSDNWMWADILAGVPLLIPRVNPMHTKVAAIRLDIESSDRSHASPRRLS